MNPLDPDIDREFTRLDVRIGRLEDMPKDVAVIARDVVEIRRDQEELKRRLNEEATELKSRLEAEAKTRTGERTADADTRKADRRWLIGALISCTVAVIGATGLLLAAFGGGHP